MKLLLFFLALFSPFFCYTQTDSLLYLNGQKITSIEAWGQRKPQLKQLILENIYGYMPEKPKANYTILKSIYAKEKGIHYKEIAIQLFKDTLPTRVIRLAVFLPSDKQSQIPIVLAINKCGNLTITDIEEVTAYTDRELHPACYKLCEKNTAVPEGLRGTRKTYWSIDTLIKRGYGFATFHDSDVGADVKSLEQGIFPFYPELINDTGWQLISAWAWGLQRAVDYLVTDEQVDKSRIIVFGHSRRGKAALLASALDERVAMVVPHQSGTGGMALGKKNPMETIYRINKTFPYWFNERFKYHSKHKKTLPIDQHYLAALMAPRPLIETIGSRDYWSSYWVSLKTLRLISPVYGLYGKKGLLGKGFIKKRREISEENIGTIIQVRRPYKHTMNGDYWNYILDIADMKLK